MPAWLKIGDANPSRLKNALLFILDGKAVEFDGFSLAVVDGVLLVHAEYASSVRDDSRGQSIFESTSSRLDELLESTPEYANELAGLPRRYSLIYSYGTGDVEVARVLDGVIEWQPGVANY